MGVARDLFTIDNLYTAADLDDPPVCCPCGCNEVSCLMCVPVWCMGKILMDALH